MRRRSLPLVLAAATTLAVTACAPQEESADAGSTGGGASSSASGGGCSPEELETLEPRTLTIATDQPAYEPWMVDDTPENGEGYESAVILDLDYWALMPR